MANPVRCEHGSPKNICERCGAQDEISTLRNRISELEKNARALVETESEIIACDHGDCTEPAMFVSDNGARHLCGAHTNELALPLETDHANARRALLARLEKP